MAAKRIKRAKRESKVEKVFNPSTGDFQPRDARELAEPGKLEVGKRQMAAVVMMLEESDLKVNAENRETWVQEQVATPVRHRNMLRRRRFVMDRPRAMINFHGDNLPVEAVLNIIFRGGLYDNKYSSIANTLSIIKEGCPERQQLPTRGYLLPDEGLQMLGQTHDYMAKQCVELGDFSMRLLGIEPSLQLYAQLPDVRGQMEGYGQETSDTIEDGDFVLGMHGMGCGKDKIAVDYRSTRGGDFGNSKIGGRLVVAKRSDLDLAA